MTFGSPRHALAYLYACEMGPSWTQVTAGPKGFNDPLDHVMVGAMLRGPRGEGCCGVEPNSDLDLELQAWARGQISRSNAVRRIERRMRDLLREHKMMLDTRCILARIKQYSDGGWFTISDQSTAQG